MTAELAGKVALVTGGSRGLGAEMVRDRLAASTALGRCGDPSEVVGAALFFATSASSYASGAVLRLDGGHG